jgi:hypothetical protein
MPSGEPHALAAITPFKMMLVMVRGLGGEGLTQGKITPNMLKSKGR